MAGDILVWDWRKRRTSPNWQISWLQTSHLHHHLVSLYEAMALPVWSFYTSLASLTYPKLDKLFKSWRSEVPTCIIYCMWKATYVKDIGVQNLEFSDGYLIRWDLILHGCQHSVTRNPILHQESVNYFSCNLLFSHWFCKKLETYQGLLNHLHT